MEQPLPSITYQRRKSFRPTNDDVLYAYKILNRYCFDNQLTRPEIIQHRVKKIWGCCEWLDQQPSGSYCKIEISDKWFCQQWFMNTLAHEMVHQFQWDVYRWEHLDSHGREMYQLSGGHGPSFFAWREQFAHYGLTLKTSFGQKRWFRHQDFSKC
jgi:hypothetical protein